MPNHLHLLIRPEKENSLSDMVRDFKKGTAYEILNLLFEEADEKTIGALTLSRPKADGQKHKVWQRKYFDFNVYSDKKIHQKLAYMHNNPVAAGLVGHPGEWRYSSYHNYYNTGKIVLEIDGLEEVTAQP